MRERERESGEGRLDSSGGTGVVSKKKDVGEETEVCAGRRYERKGN